MLLPWGTCLSMRRPSSQEPNFLLCPDRGLQEGITNHIFLNQFYEAMFLRTPCRRGLDVGEVLETALGTNYSTSDATRHQKRIRDFIP